jgi:RNA polymerase sigma factor for flagellar operon FliA
MRLTADRPDAREQRDRLVLEHLSLVRMLAGRLSRRLPSHVDGSELVGVGVMGLVDAAGRYEPSTGVPFDAFARQRIHGAMLDALRRLDRAPRAVRRQQRTLESVLGKLRQEHGREPETEEVAQAMGLSLDDYDRLLDQLQSAEVATLSRAGGPDGERSLIDLALDTNDGPYAQLERRELHRRLVGALRALPERERQIIALYYDDELTLVEIGKVFDIGPSRVSQLRTQAIARLRSLLADDMPGRPPIAEGH